MSKSTNVANITRIVVVLQNLQVDIQPGYIYNHQIEVCLLFCNTKTGRIY